MDSYTFRVMYKKVDDLPTALAGTKIYEFKYESIEMAFALAQSVAKKKKWRVVLLAEIPSKIVPALLKRWTDLRKEVGL